MPFEKPKHQQSLEEERTIREAALDQTIEASFPASDPPFSNPNPYDLAALARASREAKTLDKDTPVR